MRSIGIRTTFRNSIADPSDCKQILPGVSQHSLYEWKKRFGKPSAGSGDGDKDAEIGRLKRELARVTEERDILKKATAYFAKDAK